MTDGKAKSGLLYCGGGERRIFAFRIGRASLELVPRPAANEIISAGSGPRHLTFSPNGRFAAVVNELSNTLATFAVDPESGKLAAAGTAPILPAGFSGTSLSAEVAYHPSGKVCYASNRGHDSLAVLDADPVTGALSSPRWFPCGGRNPQHFVFGPEQSTVYVANAGSGGVVGYRLREDTLQPASVLSEIAVAQPMCLAAT